MMQRNEHRFRARYTIAIVAACVAFGAVIFAPQAFAASLYLSSNANALTTGQTFTVSVYASSEDQAMNAVSADLSFPSSKLRVLSVSEASSIVNFWVQQPSFSNAGTTGGDVVMQGVVISPGYTGGAGNIVNVIFQAIGQGTAAVSFSSGSVLANDGKGTDILTDMTGKTFTIAPAAASTGAGSGSGQVAGTSPSITATSQPSFIDGFWYNTTGTMQFAWTIPAGASGVWYDLSTSTSDAPSAGTSPSHATSTSYDLSSLPDATWRFFISADTNGIWSPVSVRILRLDRTPPASFRITRVDAVATDTQPVFSWSANDALSGVVNYQVKIGDGDWFAASMIESNGVYVLPPQSPANSRELDVIAYDRAGNSVEANTKFLVAASGCGAGAVFCAIETFAEWNWWWILIIAAALACAYAYILRLLTWKKKVVRELDEFRTVLDRDLHRFENTSGMRAGKEAERIEAEVKEEIKEIEKNL